MFIILVTLLSLLVVTIGWDRPAYTVDEDHGNLTICATAQGWTTSDNALSVPILSRTGTATRECFIDLYLLLCLKLSHL